MGNVSAMGLRDDGTVSALDDHLWLDFKIFDADDIRVSILYINKYMYTI